MSNNVDQDRLKLFTDALRSGRFQQGTGTLCRYPGGLGEKHCCLDVAIVVAVENGLEGIRHQDAIIYRLYLSNDADSEANEEFTNAEVMPRRVYEWYGFDGGDPMLELGGGFGKALATRANDELGLNFTGIADAFDRTYKTPADPEGVLEP